jgi:hypothetical protein
MIITEVFYGVKCNRCGTQYEDSEHAFWNDEGNTLEYSHSEGWNEQNGKHYCPDCHEVDDDGDLIKVYEDYPQHLKTLIKFIDNITISFSRKVFEYEDSFMIKCQLYRKPKFEPFEEDFIKGLLSDKFVSLEYEEGKYNSIFYCIKFNK